MLAVVTFMEMYANYLRARKFTLRVDCRALLWMARCAVAQNSLAHRWVTRMNGFTYGIEHRLRGKHQNADGLSKMTNHFMSLDMSGDYEPLPVDLALLRTWRSSTRSLLFDIGLEHVFS